MDIYQWDTVEKQVMNPLITRQAIHTETMTMARFELAKGSQVVEHHHANEQVTTLVKGRLRFVVAGEERILTAGEILRLPPHVPHSVDALEDSVAVDLFSPRREDWIRGDDAYLRK